MQREERNDQVALRPKSAKYGFHIAIYTLT
jgi:hypothetical protein